ncbi:MAG: Sir2 family NAD-dependent protein deacetylase [Acidobacteriota bacterium]
MPANEELTRLLGRAERVLVFTGAGVSTSSGIPDFRGPQGVWKRRQPVMFQDFVASEESRVEYWDQKAEGWEGFRDAQPTPTHRALVELEELGRLEAVLTQNIDGLHQAAGTSSERLLELHGTNRWVECLDCGERTDPDPSVAEFRETRACPRCPCGGLRKFATISFGQALEPEILQRAASHAQSADLALAMGSTLSVTPACLFPALVKEQGHPLIIINQGETDLDGAADLRLDGSLDALVPPAISALRTEST